MLSEFPLANIFDEDGVAIFAKPLASDKMLKRICKLLKASKEERKKHVILGIKPVVKAIEKDKTGIVVLTGDVKQVDMIAHVPILCEKYSVPYIWVRERRNLCSEDTGLRPKSIPCCMLLMRENLEPKLQGKFDELADKVRKAYPTEF